MSFISRLGLCAAACLLTTSAASAQPAPDAPARADRGRLRPRRTIHDLQHDAARAADRRARVVAAGRPVRSLLVPRDDGEGHRGRAGRSRKGHQVALRPAALQGGGARGSRARRGRRPAAATPSCRPTASAPPSSATGTSGCATSPPAAKRSSPRTASRTSVTPPTTPAGHAATAPILRWSPDSKKIATFQQDQRGVGEMYLVDTTVGHPTLQAWKYPLPGDQTVTMIQRVVIDVDSGEDGPPPDAARSASLDAVRRRGLPRRLGRRAVEPGRIDRGVRLDRARSPARAAARRRRGHRRSSATCSRRRPRRSSSRATARSTGAICRRRTK